MNTAIVNYKEVFQLAESKGCKELTAGIIIESLHAERKWDIEDYLTLCLIQKWLRDKHKKEIIVKSCGSIDNYLFKVMELGEDKCLSFCSNTFCTYEESLLHGINKALGFI